MAKTTPKKSLFARILAFLGASLSDTRRTRRPRRTPGRGAALTCPSCGTPVPFQTAKTRR